jgi:protein-tyrosine-phosphatase
MKILFVCSGNTCRSPLAVAAWNVSARELHGLEHIEVDSAGLCPDDNAPAAYYSIKIAKSWGEDLSQHRTKMFSLEYADSDLIITLTTDQANVIKSHFNLDDRTVRVLGSFACHKTKSATVAQLSPLWGSDAKELSSPNDDILDPHGGSYEAYLDCARQIRAAVTELARNLSASKPLEEL